MIVKLLDNVFAEIVMQSSHLQISPRWVIGGLYVIVTSCNSMKEYDQQIGNTFGSFDFLWFGSEGMRFSQKNLLLQSICFKVPEVNLTSNKELFIWQNLKPKIGSLQLLSAQEFHLEPTDVRCFDSNTGNLICMYKSAFKVDGDRFRLRIVKDFDLLFVEQRLCGWLLSSAEQYLVDLWEVPVTTTVNKQLKVLLSESLSLVSEPNIEKMEEQDPEVLKMLVDLYDRIKYSCGFIHQGKVIYTWIAEIIERFYDQIIN